MGNETDVYSDVYCDKAPTNKGKCFRCRKAILKGTPRIYYYDTLRKVVNKIEGLTCKRLLCYDCAIGHLDACLSIIKRKLGTLFKLKRRLLRVARGKRAKALLLKSKVYDNVTTEQ